MARRRSAPRPFSRTDRVGELVREIVASELERIGDERLEMVTVTAVNVDASLEHADVFYSALQAEEEDRADEVAEALDDVRWPVQQVVNRQVRTRRTPQIRFRPDTVLTSALRIEGILRELDDSADGGGVPDGSPRNRSRDTRGRRRGTDPGGRGRGPPVNDRGPAGPAPSGLCVIDKPSGWTSHDVVAKARGVLGTRKVGHSGTLDPMATGVLVLGVGNCTRLLTFLTGLDKVYDATIRFGVETDSLDADGEVVATYDMSGLDGGDVVAAAATLTGPIEQVPPMVSAIKVGGRRLHELARAGIEVDREARPVTVSRFDLSPTSDPLEWRATVACSSGTYVRVLAADLGTALGGGAHLTALRRRAVGPFTLDESTTLDDAVVLPGSTITRVLAPCQVDAAVAIDVGHGKVLDRERLGVDPRAEGGGPDGPWAVLGPAGDLIAVYIAHRADTVKPALVLA